MFAHKTMHALRGGRQGPARALLYVLLCQAGWFVCVLGAARGCALTGMLYASGLVAWHCAGSADGRREACWVALAVSLGWLWESALVRAGLLGYRGYAGPVAPYWMMALWALFAIQFNVLFVWLRGRPWLASLLGAAAAPLSFRAGAALGAVQFFHPALALVTLAAGWAMLMPLLLRLAQRWDGVNTPSP